MPAGLDAEIETGLAHIERIAGAGFGDPGPHAAGLRPLRRSRLHARHDGHGPQPRPQRRDGGRPRARERRCPLRLRQLPPPDPDVRRCRPRRPPPRLRGAAGAREGSARLPPRHRHGGGRLVPPDRGLQGAGAGRDRQRLPAGRAGAAQGRDPRGPRFMDERARRHLPPAARHPGRVGHGGHGAGHGVRQHGGRLRHRRRLHPQSRPPAMRRSTASTWSTRRARTWWPASARPAP